MLKIKTLCILGLLLCLFSVGVYSQKSDLRFKHISVQDGLSQSSVNCVVQDSKGFMWFGTNDGLNRYDGYDIKTYKNNSSDPTSLGSNEILSLFVDRDGVLWVGTYGGGLNRFNHDKDCFTQYKHDPSDPYSLGSNHVADIQEGETGCLWVGTYGGGLNRLDRNTGKFTRLIDNKNDPHRMNEKIVKTIFPASGGVLWLGSMKGLYRFDPGQKEYIHFEHDPKVPGSVSDNRVWMIHQTQMGKILIGTPDGLNLFDETTGQFTSYKNETGNPHSLSGNWVTSICEDSEGGIWMGTYDGGLNYFDPETERFTSYTHDPKNPLSLSNNKILCLYKDSSGVMWIGAESGGVNKLVFDPFTLHHHEAQASGSLSGKVAQAIYEGRSGCLWLGTDQGLNKYNPQNRQVTHYQHQKGNVHGLSHNRVTAITEDRNGFLWIATGEGGLNRLDPKGNKFTVYWQEKSKPHSLSSNWVASLCEDHQGILWVGTLRGGLNRFIPDSGRFAHYKHDKSNPHSLSSDNVTTLFEDRSGILWVGTEVGLNRLNREDRTFTRYVKGLDKLGGLSHNRIFSIYEDQSGGLWIGTGDGLNKMNRDTGECRVFRKADGLPNDFICGMLEDNQGNLWISTKKGLSKFNPEIGTFRNYDTEDGLQSNEFMDGVCFKSKQTGEMFFGGINGFDSFFPAQIKTDTYAPPVAITKFFLSNQPMALQRENPGSPLTNTINETKEITLDYEQRNLIAFEFSALHFAHPSKNRYAYKLEGWDRDWIEGGSQNRWATYSNLDHGNYVFRVKAANKDGIWNEEGASVKLKVLPIWWKSWWAITLYVLAFCGFLGLILWIQHKKILYERAELQRMRQLEKLKEQLVQSDKMAALGTLVAGVAHELNNPAGFIMLNSEFLARAWRDIVPILNRFAQSGEKIEIAGLPYQESKSEIADLVTGLQDGSQRIKAIIDELKNFSRKEESSKREAVDINKVIRSSLHLTHNLIKTSTKHFFYDEEEGLPFAYGSPQKLGQVMINLIQNACHALPNNTCSVSLSSTFDKANQRVIIRVSDEGEGIAEKDLKFITDPFFTTKRHRGGTGLGLSISAHIIQEFGGFLDFNSTPGKGTTVSVHLPVEANK